MARLAQSVLNLSSRVSSQGLHRNFGSAAPAGQGLNFNVTDEQKELLDVAEKFTREEIIPAAPQYDKVSNFEFRRCILFLSFFLSSLSISYFLL